MVNIAGSLDILSWLLGMVGFLLTMLIGILSWIGSRVHSRLDAISTSLEAIETDLRKDFSALDRRVYSLESVQAYMSSNVRPFKPRTDNGNRARKTDQDTKK